MKRRDFIKLSVVTSIWLLSGCGGSSSSSQTSNKPLTNNSLPIPELIEPTIKDGVKHFDLTLQEAKHQFFDGEKTNTYAINSTYLGPTIKVKNGDEVSINYTNKLPEKTTMHAHGMHVPAKMDGTPHQIIEPNQTWSARYKVKQKAATNWYHPHLMSKTAEHVYKGLAGFIIVEDDEILSLDLPKRYGIDDIPLVLQDRRFKDNQIDYSPTRQEIMHGYKGDTFIVNGAITPTFDAEAKEIRFRILNGSNSSVYELGFDDQREFSQIATDNALLETPIKLTKLTLSPGERAEIVVDFTNDLGSKITLHEYNRDKTFLYIDINRQKTTSTTLPTSLTTLEKLNPDNAVRTRKFILSGGGMGGGGMSNSDTSNMFKINGKSMDMSRIDEYVPLNDIEIWEVQNSMNMDHNFHIHATHFMIIERNGSSSNIPKNEKGYKDTVYLRANESVKFIVKMVDYADNEVPYMYHCHFLEHEDAGMMGQFVVTS